ncbi:MAG: hypothetical protein WBK91_07620 [Alphaproteobacteria bacterium]
MVAIIEGYKMLSGWTLRRNPPSHISVPAITHVVFNDRSLGANPKSAEIHVAGEPHPYAATMESDQFKEILKTAGIAPFPTLLRPQVDGVGRYGALITPEAVNYIFIPQNTNDNAVLHLIGGKKVTLTAEKPGYILPEFQTAKVDLTPVPLLNREGTAYVVASKVATVTEEPFASLSERTTAGLSCIWMRKSNRAGSRHLTEVHAPRKVITLKDGTEILGNFNWNRAALTPSSRASGRFASLRL